MLFVSGSILVTLLFVLGFLFFILKEQIISDVRKQVEIAAATGAKLLRGEDIQQLRQASDYKKPGYAKVYAGLRSIYLANKMNNFKLDNFYVIRKDKEYPAHKKRYTQYG